MVVKSEANAHGTNRRFVVTKPPRAVRLYPEATYDEYVMRGESENRNKELEVWAGNRSAEQTTVSVANLFRMYSGMPPR